MCYSVCRRLCALFVGGFGGAGGDTLCATLYAAGWALFAGGYGDDALCAWYSVCRRVGSFSGVRGFRCFVAASRRMDCI